MCPRKRLRSAPDALDYFFRSLWKSCPSLFHDRLTSRSRFASQEDEWGPGACIACARAIGPPPVFQEERGQRESGQRASSITDSM
jgi:hypothetical protein